MKYQKLNEINYLRTFEAAKAMKSNTPFLWTERIPALGAISVGVWVAVFEMIRYAPIRELRIFDLLKNTSMYDAVKITPQGMEAISIVVPACVGAIAAVASLVFLINKDQQIFNWENYAKMTLGRIDSHIMLSKNQVELLLWGAPKEYRKALEKYTLVEDRIIRVSNAVEAVALNQLLKTISVSAHINKLKVYEAALSECKVLVGDPRIVEVFLKGQLTPINCKAINAFAKYCNFTNLTAVSDKWNKIPKSIDRTLKEL
ncbi:MAG: hypothetical protein H0U49_11840 [Parachlamydiaceae bacterium]|nr:hypothetical protein [Parachlamydiaceae bacterium]